MLLSQHVDVENELLPAKVAPEVVKDVKLIYDQDTKEFVRWLRSQTLWCVRTVRN
jgi:hypothetical protein